MAFVAPKLTAKQERILAVLTDTPTLAYDLAQAAEIDNRSAGAVLLSLEAKGRAAREWSAKDRAYKWRRIELPV